jgi:hypothetical protein
MTSRDKIYIEILHFGLMSLRESAFLDKVDLCTIEAEHLHNIPSLIGEPNEGRHIYYFDCERVSYIEKVNKIFAESPFILNRYNELWKQLHELNKTGV